MTLNVINADCEQELKKYPDKYFDLIITDPPYGIGINKMNFVTSGAIKVGGAYRNDYSNHNTEWDNNIPSKSIFDEIFRVSKNQIIFGAEHLCHELPLSRGWIIWDKRCEDKYSNDFADCELIWTSFDKPSKIFRYLWSGMIQQEMGLYKEKRLHPTQKPLALIRWLLTEYSDKDCKICDPFLGSGSTIEACKQLGRSCIGIEINPEYVAIANKRLQQEVLIT